jgi:hypothetical protein
MIEAAEILSIPIYATTQNKKALGETCSEIDISKAVAVVDKTRFSMWIPAISSHFSSTTPSEIALLGIELHICITQTALDLKAAGHKVYVLADGVSSCNQGEVGVALDRLRHEGVTVTTSESWLYECMGDAKIEEFKKIGALVKKESANTKAVVGTVLSKI